MKGGFIRMSKPNVDKIMKALAKYGIHNAEELNEAMKKMKPLDITCMVSPMKGDPGLNSPLKK